MRFSPSRVALVAFASLVAPLAGAACGADGSAGDGGGGDAAVVPAVDASILDGSVDAAVSLDALVTDAPASDTSLPEDAAVVDAAPLPDSAPVDAGAPYDESLFMATHNSYSGGDRGAIVAQLDEGVRFVELDIHDDNFDTIHDYQIGHDNPGNQVALGAPNPTTLLFRDWLGVIANWSTAHPHHAPIALALDLKSDLTDNASFALGNLGAVNGALASAFGARLLAARDVPAPWPGVETMRGRIMVVLSGDEGTRRAYRLDAASVASVGMNAAGNVVEVHASSHGDLWYWTGAFDPAGAVRWSRHARFGKGTAPAVALSDSGLVIEAHESGSGALTARVGVLGSDLDIVWQSELPLGKGTKPSVRVLNGGPAVRAVWTGSGTATMALGGALDTASPVVHWDAAGAQTTSDPRFDTQRDERAGRWVSVRTGQDGLAPSDTLLYSTSTTAVDRVRYDQLAFVEHQKGGDTLLEQEARFYAAAATEKSWLASVRSGGHVVRGWQFDDASMATTPASNFPATDTPAAAWYVTYAQQNGAVQ